MKVLKEVIELIAAMSIEKGLVIIVLLALSLLGYSLCLIRLTLNKR
jgi:hypothetical protein